LKLSEQFEHEVEIAFSALSENEWAVAQMRDRLCAEALATMAFENVVDVLRIAERKPDTFLECSWMALALARRSETTQIPEGLESAVANLVEIAEEQGLTSELKNICAWYRLSPNLSFKQTR
jgi:hypothetical protein